MVRLSVALVDGSVIDEYFPNHELDTLEIMVKESEDSLIVRIEIEDSKGKLIHTYKRKTHYAY